MRGPFLFGVAVTLTALGCAAALAGCTGDIGGDERQQVPGPPDVVPLDVPASPEVLASSASCTALRPEEELLSVSPEGHAWLVVRGSSASVRVLDPFDGEMTEVVEDVELADLEVAQAWTESDAALIANGGLWRLEDLARIELTPPEGFLTPAALCGDPSANGALVSAGQVFEHKVDDADVGAWWGWNPGFVGDAAPQALVPFDGECQATDEVMWLTAPDGTLFRVETSQFSRPVRFSSLVSAAAVDGMLAVLESDKLWIGPDSWQSWVFPGPTPQALSASGDHLWMVSGDQLLRFDGEVFVEVTHAMEEPITRVAAHPSGVWLVGAETVCHQSVAPLLRVEGIRPYLQSSELEHAIRVKASDGADVVAELDEEPIELTLDDSTGWYEGNVRLDPIGWHTLILRAEGSVEANRSIALKRLPEALRSWEADIAPIYQESCVDNECHHPGSTDPPDLGSYEAWQSHADAIRAQVVEGKNMPPAANVGPEWGPEKIEIVNEWLEGGMLP